ncbi:glycoside hydrolase family 92 protein [Aaosphaeria arxii CBS 175.79]|uniref:Glycoside hydrolase family 92 protein n=1 Tax=Aaosphaeria arxii CBS 175.79 TaxID=1450172 RepID=A0A6A5Y9V3_9PLEO|nr:glycoside hydrolase family 92 protein [Aaosphaeria arxii CBS 175.79]KAF2022218.1 glycoside hydrolase family 92 protein [Aaosphaeria arxii CBS 175.79]
MLVSLLGILEMVFAGGPEVGGEEDLTRHVNVFQGTTKGGNRFPGVVAAPFAMVKLGPDVMNGRHDAYSGYLPEGRVWGFSMMHESGTGGAPKYGVVSQMPVVGDIANPLLDLSQDRAVPDEAEIGYYKSSLANGVAVELSATQHAGLYRYTFSKTNTSLFGNSSSSNMHSIVVDVSHVLPSFRRFGWEQHYSGGEFEYDATDGHYQGFGTYNNGWNLSPDWNIYFCGRFSKEPESWKIFKGTNSSGETLAEYGSNEKVSGTQRLGGVFTFKERELRSRVGISFLSTEQACENLDREISTETTIEELASTAKSTWNAEVLNKIQVEGATEADTKLLYSSLLGMFLIPSNRTGENAAWDGTEPYYDDVFTLWDTHRCQTSLFHIVNPTAYEEFIRSLIDIWRHDGFMPDARSSNFNGRVQVGSNADNVLADAYVKNVRGAVNWHNGFLAMQTDAEIAPPPNNDPMAPDSSTKEGRGALPDWLKYGYITPAYTRSVSRAIEYSNNDFGLYQMAQGLGYDDDAAKYLNRSRNWRNHWNPRAESNNHTGFMVPRLANGSFVDQDPLSCGGCYWGDAYYEDNPWIYSLNALHDIARLKALSGGDEKFVDRVDKLFDLNIFNAGNEPGFTSPFLYNFVPGMQWKSVERSRREIGRLYSAEPGGLPGNSDGGAMESNIIWQMIGLWPLTGQTTFLILSPWFPRMTIDLGTGKTLTITTTGGDKDTAFYVQSLKVNGEEWNQSWVSWQDVFEDGGKMEYVLGAEPRAWGSEVPPSPASGDG